MKVIIQCECRYCDHQWTLDKVWMKPWCVKCKSEDVKKREIELKDYYNET